MEKNNNFGVGVDIESITRFNNLNLLKNKSSLDKIFTENELRYCFSKKDASPHLSARFSAKEAVFKALSSIGVKIQNKKDIEIINDKKGIPKVQINNREHMNITVGISLSHCDDKSIAFAIATKNESKED